MYKNKILCEFKFYIQNEIKLSLINKKKSYIKNQNLHLYFFYYIQLWIKFKFKIIYFLNTLFYKSSMSILKIMCNLITTSHNSSKNFFYKTIIWCGNKTRLQTFDPFLWSWMKAQVNEFIIVSNGKRKLYFSLLLFFKVWQQTGKNLLLKVSIQNF